MRKSLFSLAAITFLAAMMSACGSDNALTGEDNNDNKQPVTAEGIQFRTTIGAKTDGTRALADPNNGTLTASWEADEKLALILNGVKYEATVDEVRRDGSAVISATIPSGTADGTEVSLVYPYSAANDDGTIVEDLLGEQDGTLESVGKKYDVATGTGTLDVMGMFATLESDASLTNQYAICKFTFTDRGSRITAIKQVMVYNSSNERTMTITNEDGLDEVYMAMPSSSEKMLFVVTTSSTFYTGTATASLSTGKFYQPTIGTRERDWSLGDVNDADFLGKLVCTNGKVLYTDTQAAILGYTPAAMICHVGDDAGCSHGLAVALGDAGSAAWGPINYNDPAMSTDEPLTNCSDLASAQNDLDGLSNTNIMVEKYPSSSYAFNLARNYSSTVSVPPGASEWFLPTMGQMVKFVNNYGGRSADSYTSIKKAMENVGGTMFPDVDSYHGGNPGYYFYHWTSTEAYYYSANAFGFSASNGYSTITGPSSGNLKSIDFHFRPFISF